MATDATLVNAAYREAMANVPKFDPNIAKSQAGLVGNIMDPIAEAIEAKDLELKQKNEEYDNLKDDQIAKFTDTADAINIRLSSFENGGRDAGMHEQIYNNTYNHLDELKQEYELYNTVGDDDTPENKKKRIEILGKLEGVKNATTQLRADILEIGKLAGSKDGGSQMSKHGMTASEIAMTNEILNMDGDYNNVKQRWDKKTNSMFFDVTIPDDVFSKLPPKEQELGQTRTWSAKDIKENFYPIPKEMEGSLIQQSGDYEKASKKAKWDDKFDLQMSADETAEILGNDKKAASHIFQTRQHGQPKTGYNVPGGASNKWETGSWANALEAHTDLNGTAYKLDPTANMEIVTDLINSGEVGMSEIDGIDGSTADNKISAEELEAFMSTKNRDEVIDVLVNHKNPLYDHKLSVEEFSMWRARQNETKFNENKPDKPEEKNDSDPDDDSKGKIDLGVSRLTNQRVYAARQDVKAKYDQIIGSKKGDAIEGWDGKKTYQYLNRGNGKWQYQVWDSELQMFVTKGGGKEAAGGGEGSKVFDINGVIGELIPQTMLQNSNKTKFTW